MTTGDPPKDYCYKCNGRHTTVDCYPLKWRLGFDPGAPVRDVSASDDMVMMCVVETKAKQQSEIDSLRRELEETKFALSVALATADRRHAEHLNACELVAKMHEAAVGEVRGPIRGLIEDVEDVRRQRDDWEHTAKMYAAACRAEKQQRERELKAKLVDLARELLNAAMDSGQLRGKDYEAHERRIHELGTPTGSRSNDG